MRQCEKMKTKGKYRKKLSYKMKDLSICTDLAEGRAQKNLRSICFDEQSEH